MRLGEQVGSGVLRCRFPFLLGGAFIEADVKELREKED